jgi:hypothetical protein
VRDEPDYEGGCLVLGRPHSKYENARYRVCLTSNQDRVLFNGKRKRAKKLGCGVFACAYTAPGAKAVVKFTRDSEDVAALLQAQRTGVVPKITKVYKLGQGGRTMPERIPGMYSQPSPRDVPVYALVMERLRTIPLNQQSDLNIELGVLGMLLRRGASTKGLCSVIEQDDGSVGCTDLQRTVIAAYDKLAKRGIFWEDIHAGNIGYDKTGKLKVLDLGLTQTELKRRIKVLKGLGGAKREKKLKRLRLI